MALTKKDLEQISKLINDALIMNNVRLMDAFATKEDLKRLNEDLKSEFSHLPTKDEFYKKMDEQVVELKALREEIQTTSDRSVKNRDQIEIIKSKLGIVSNLVPQVKHFPTFKA